MIDAKTRPHHLWQVIALIVVGLSVSALPRTDKPLSAAQKKRFAYPVGPGLGIRTSTMCLFIVAAMRSGDFFDRLEVYETPSGVVFRKHGAKLDHFPDDTDIRIQFSLSPSFCGPGSKRSFDEDRAKAIQQSLHFELLWKQGVEEFPVESREPIKLVMEPTKGTQDPFFKEPYSALDGFVWAFLCHAASGKIPLTAHLELKVYDEHNTLLARGTVIDLTSPPGPRPLK
jgi:hypothetical protein